MVWILSIHTGFCVTHNIQTHEYNNVTRLNSNLQNSQTRQRDFGLTIQKGYGSIRSFFCFNFNFQNQRFFL